MRCWYGMQKTCFEERFFMIELSYEPALKGLFPSEMVSASNHNETLAW